MAWMPVQQHAFESLKARILQTPVLIHHDHTKSYMLHTDASYVGVEATLSQLDTEGLPRRVACRSRKFNKGTDCAERGTVFFSEKTKKITILGHFVDCRN